MLVVDDNQAATIVMSETLTEMGFDVESASSGQAALQRVEKADARQRPFAFVLMDWLMPAMDGLETTRRLKTLKVQTVPSVILVTAHRREELLHLSLIHI